MTRVLETWSILAMLLAACVGCGESTPKAAAPSAGNADVQAEASPAAQSAETTDDLPGLTEQLVAELKTVTDEASAKAAAPKLEALAEKVHAIHVEMKEGKAPAGALSTDFADRQAAALEAYGKELQRISEKPEAAKELQGMIQKLAP